MEDLKEMETTFEGTFQGLKRAVLEDERRQIREKTPVGTALWQMSGIPQKDGKTYWSAECYAVQTVDENKFMCRHGGGSWNNIGRTFFYSREDCLADWGDKPLVTETVTMENKPKKDVNLEQKTIYRDDGVTIVTIAIGQYGYTNIPLDDFEWHVDAQMKKMAGCGDWLALGEIRDKLWKKYKTSVTIEVRLESPLHGVIYQVGNYPNDKAWREHGTTRGYA